MGDTSLSFSYIVGDASHPDVATGAATAPVQIPLLSANRPPTCAAQQIDVDADSPNPVRSRSTSLPNAPITTATGGAVARDEPVDRQRRAAIAGVLRSGSGPTRSSSNGMQPPRVRCWCATRCRTSRRAAASWRRGDVVIAIVGNTPPTVATLNRRSKAGASPGDRERNGAVTDPDPGDVDAMAFVAVGGGDGLTVELSGGVLTLRAPRSDLVVAGGEPKTFTITYTATDRRRRNESPGTVNVVVTASDNKPGRRPATTGWRT